MQPPPFDLTPEESAEVAKHIAAAVDRIGDGARMVCYNMQNPDGTPRVDEHGRCLVYLVTNDPELWGRVMELAKRFGVYTRAREGQRQPPPQEPPHPLTIV